MNRSFYLISMLPLVVSPAFAGQRKASLAETPVRATLGDGQVLMGEVHTRTLRLTTGSGELEIPLADVGEVVPATGGQLGEADGRVDVWLRNGSELRGTWADPHLAMSIRVGGADVPVDLPMNDLSRFQLQGDARWPGGPVYRMKTRFGDDFLVDPSRTRLVVVNDLGTFSPLLSECASVAPVGDPQGPWRVTLQTGTVLLGELQDDQVTVALPMGPSEVSVPLEQFVSLKVESWTPVASGGPRRDKAAEVAPPALETLSAYDGAPVGGAVYPSADVSYAPPERAYVDEPAGGAASPSRARPAAAAPAWFDSAALAESKKASGESP